MAERKYVYQDWIVELGRDPADSGDPASGQPPVEIAEAVATALLQLSDDEREFVERFHFMGQSYRGIAETSGRSISRLEALHRRVMAKLKRELGPFVRERYGLAVEPPGGCPICRSRHRQEIDVLLDQKDERETWRRTMVQLRDQFGVAVRSPQTLIGHQKYH